MEHANPPLKLLFIFGTRPEAIKMAPLVLEARKRPAFQPLVCLTGQHKEMLRQVTDFFGIDADYDLGLMTPGQTLAGLTARLVAALDETIADANPGLVLTQGDTTTAFIGGLAAFYRGAPRGHVEAGLRSGDLNRPFPEEANRAMLARIADFHFAPTPAAVENLAKEGILERVVETGNTVLDALFLAREILKAPALEERFRLVVPGLDENKETILVTCHRRENFGAPLLEVIAAVRELADAHPDRQYLWPVHLNPNVRETVWNALGAVSNVFLTEPLGYPQMVRALDLCRFALTDSGGVQEEAPALGKPVVVLRDVTERSEAVDAGRAVLAGANKTRILAAAEPLMTDTEIYRQMAQPFSPYIQGSASGHILDYIEQEMVR